MTKPAFGWTIILVVWVVFLMYKYITSEVEEIKSKVQNIIQYVQKGKTIPQFGSDLKECEDLLETDGEPTIFTYNATRQMGYSYEKSKRDVKRLDECMLNKGWEHLR